MSGHPSIYETDLYKLLQVHPKADPAVVTAAYKSLLKQCAPRALHDTESAAKTLGEAHVVLSDPRERRKYDEYRISVLKKHKVGPYQILEEVAQGGFGTTYKAAHIAHGQHSCIKHCHEISARAEEILKHEASSIWNLRHYGLPCMRDLIQRDDGSIVLVMSWIEGPTLEQLVKKHGKLDPENVAWVTERILNTLMYTHDNGVLHGDIKPQNIIVQESHIVVMVDFGLAAVKPSSTHRSLGYTELFSPPEQIGGKPLVPGSDFYSLGMTMLYALGGGAEAAQRKNVPAHVPDAMCDFIKSLLVRDVLSRPKNAHELFAKFKQVRLKSFGRESSNQKQFTL